MYDLIEIQTSVGNIHVPNNGQHINITKNIVDQDYYRIRKLHRLQFNPKIILDIGSSIGSFVKLCANVYPSAKIYAFDIDENNCYANRLNNPNANVFHTGISGFIDQPAKKTYRYTQHTQEDLIEGFYADKQKHPLISVREMIDLCGTDRFDLIRLDCQEAEVEILREMNELDLIKSIPVIVGEWYGNNAKQIVKNLLKPTHIVNMIGNNNPKESCAEFYAAHRNRKRLANWVFPLIL